MTTPAHPAESANQAHLSSIESAQQAAVDNTRRPKWLVAAYTITLGTALSLVQLRTPTAGIIGGILVMVAIVVYRIIDVRLKRRRGTLLKFSGGSVLAAIVMVATMVFIIQIQPAASWQPWFSIGLGVALATAGYIYIRWDEADTAKKLAAGDFDPNDLMP